MKLDARLQAAADAAGRRALFADIGSDHAAGAVPAGDEGAAVCADPRSPLARGQQAAARGGWRIGRPSSCPTGWTRCPSGRTSPRSAGWAGADRRHRRACAAPLSPAVRPCGSYSSR